MSDLVEVWVNGVTYGLHKIHRHLLYAMDEGREPSSKYSPDEIRAGYEYLNLLGLCELDPDTDSSGERGHRVTGDGVQVTEQCRAFHAGGQS